MIPFFASPIRYACNQCGECCRIHQIPLTYLDLLRFIEGQLPLEEMIELEKVNPLAEDAIFLAGEFYHFFLKYDQEGKACKFLRADNGCGIHPHRPYACRIYPMDLTPRGLLKIMPEAEDTTRKYCDQTPLSKADRQYFMEWLRKGEREGQQNQEVIRRWNQRKSKESQTLANFLEYIQEIHEILNPKI